MGSFVVDFATLNPCRVNYLVLTRRIQSFSPSVSIRVASFSAPWDNGAARNPWLMFICVLHGYSFLCALCDLCGSIF